MSLKPEDCKPGTLVECYRLYNPQAELQIGGIYTIERLIIGPHGPAIRLNEAPVPRDILAVRPNAGWKLDLFRLLHDSRLDVFRAMLAPVDKKTKEDA